MMAKRGFSLIELLVVISIITIITGMLSIVLGIAQRKARDVNTRSILMKVDQAVRLFRNDTRTYPWNTDLSTADIDPTKWTNDLAFRLAWRPADATERNAYLTSMQADISAINSAFRFIDGQNVTSGIDGTHAFRAEDLIVAGYRTNVLLKEFSGNPATHLLMRPNSDFGPAYNAGAHQHLPMVTSIYSGEGNTTAFVLTRLASEITALRYLAGQVPTQAPQGLDPAIPADKAKRPKLEARYPTLRYSLQQGNAVLPPQGTPMNGYSYVPYNKPGTLGDDSRGPALTAAAAQARGWRGEYLADALRRRSATTASGEIDVTGQAILDAYGNPLVYICTFSPGARGYGYDFMTGGIDELDYAMGPSGRVLTELLASDVRSTASKPYTLEFELWSPGRDGLFSATRGDSQNRDNISLLPYTKGLR